MSKQESLISQDTFLDERHNNYQLVDPRLLEESQQQSGAVIESMITETINEYIKVGQPFIALNLMIQTEYCSGNTLRDFILARRGKVSRKDNLKLFSQIVDGVITIHQASIIHRDLKPDNIFLDEKDNVKIGDFGLARAFQKMGGNN